MTAGVCSEDLQQRLRTYSLDDAIRRIVSPEKASRQDRVCPLSDMEDLDSYWAEAFWRHWFRFQGRDTHDVGKWLDRL